MHSSVVPSHICSLACKEHRVFKRTSQSLVGAIRADFSVTVCTARKWIALPVMTVAVFQIALQGRGIQPKNTAESLQATVHDLRMILPRQPIRTIKRSPPGNDRKLLRHRRPPGRKPRILRKQEAQVCERLRFAFSWLNLIPESPTETQNQADHSAHLQPIKRIELGFRQAWRELDGALASDRRL